MTRDPSDGSVKPSERGAENPGGAQGIEAGRAKYGPNWGLNSLSRPAKQTTPAPTPEQLTEYYKVYDVGGKLKEST